MKDGEKTKEQLIDELEQLRQRTAELEAGEAENKKTEEVLRESEVRYKELAESITDVFFAIDENLKYTYWNKASEELMGILAKEALGKSIFDIFPDDESTRRAVNAYRKALATKEPQHFVSERSLGGIDYIFDMSVYPTKGGLCVYVKDVTERRKLEKALEESEQWYRLIFDNTPIGIGFASLDGKVITFNKAMEWITGYSAEEFNRINIIDMYVDKADREAFLKELRQHGSVVDYPVRLKRKDNTQFDALMTSKLTAIGDKKFVQTIAQDVTERKRAENAIIMANERLQFLLSSTSAVIYTAKPSGDYGATFVSQNVIRMSGYEPSNFLESSSFWIDHVHPDDVTRILAELPHIFEHDYYSYEYRFKCKDGKYIWVSDYMRLVRNDSGEPVEIVGYWVDVTERRRAEEALRESEERYRALVELSPEAIFVASDGKHVFVNSAGLKLFGASSPDQILGKQVMDVIRPDYHEAVAERIQEAMRTGKAPPAAEEKFLRLDGTEIDVEVRAAPLIYQGRPAMQAVVRDISDRKQAEETLRLSEQNFRDSIESSPLGIRIVDEDGNTLYANQSFLDIYGYNSLDILEAVPRRKRYTPKSYKEHDERIKKRKRGEYVPSNYEISIVRKDGQIRHLAVSRGEVLWDGKRQFQVLYQDISERKQAEKSLKESEEKFRLLTEKSVIGIYIIQDSKMAYVNPSCAKIFGYEPEEIIGLLTPADIIHPDDIGSVMKRLSERLEGKVEGREISYRAIKKDGSIIYVEVYGMLIDYQGKPGVMGTLIDVTERKRAEEQLQQEKGRAQRYLDIAGVILVANDAHGRVTMINKRGCEVLGYDQEEIIGQNWFDMVIPSKSSREVKRIFKKLMAGEVEPVAYFENPVLTKKGEERIIAWNNVILKDGAGNIVGTLSSGEDITERKKAEEALQASEERYRLLAENVRDVIWSTDMDLRFTYVSPSIKYIGDRTAEEVMSMSLGQLLTPSSQELAMKTFAEELLIANVRSGDPYRSRTLEVEFLRRDGTILWAELKMNFMREPDGRPTGILGVMRDISERRKAEEERRTLEQKALLASRLASVGELASGIAHEINNPLTGVIGYAELLIQEDVPEHIKNDLEIVYDGAKRVADIVKGLLKFARQTKPERTLVNINEIIGVNLRLRAYEMETGNIKVITKLDPDIPLTVADAGQLQQVFVNLLINAETEMKLAHGKGKLTVKTEHIDGKIRISFKDNGPGIAKENLERIFDPFFTTREMGKGTGLGLSICHGIITEHGGRIWAESQPGRGASFIVELPVITEEKRPRRVTSARKPQKTTKGRILLVDDEPVVRQLVTEVLSAEGHEVETTADGMDALKKIKGNGYDLILVDMKLPGISGGELYDRIQDMAEKLAERVIFVTGDVMGADTEAFLAKTGAPFIAKPFNVKQLKAEVRRLLTKPRPKSTAKSEIRILE